MGFEYDFASIEIWINSAIGEALKFEFRIISFRVSFEMFMMVFFRIEVTEFSTKVDVSKCSARILVSIIISRSAQLACHLVSCLTIKLILCSQERKKNPRFMHRADQ